MELYLIRHTSVDVSKDICYGFSDVDVSDKFETEANRLKNLFLEQRGFVVYSSSLTRCTKLAKYIFNDEIITDDNLKELNFGDWELKSWNDIDKSDEFHYWAEDVVTRPCPNGESFNDLLKRVKSFYNKIIDDKNLSKVVIVTHGGVIRSILSCLLQIPLKNSYMLEVDYASVTKVVLNADNVKIKYVNK